MATPHQVNVVPHTIVALKVNPFQKEYVSVVLKLQDFFVVELFMLLSNGHSVVVVLEAFSVLFICNTILRVTGRDAQVNNDVNLVNNFANFGFVKANCSDIP